MDDPRPILIQWSTSSYSGWGNYGLQLAMTWSLQGRYAPMCSVPVRLEELALSPPEWRRIAPFLRRSEQVVEQLAPYAGQEVSVPLPVLRGLGNNLVGSRSAGKTTVLGTPTVGVCYLEDTDLGDDARARAASCAVILAGSRWVREVLAAAGIGPVVTVHQGFDPTHFHPGPRAGWFRGRFAVFSGGKLEHRKGQDLVLRAFRAFAARHREALLVTLWHSPWPEAAASLSAAGTVAPVPLDADGRVDAVGWAVANGIAADQVVDLGPVPNGDLARILREVDVALFPNRCEGGTNMVATECLACGVPTILSDNTGHRDVIVDGACLPLTRQSPLSLPGGSQGWGESDVEEIVEALESVWRDRDAAAAMGRRAAGAVAWMSAEHHADAVAAAVEAHL